MEGLNLPKKTKLAPRGFLTDLPKPKKEERPQQLFEIVAQLEQIKNSATEKKDEIPSENHKEDLNNINRKLE